jgi:hypothetical protein
MANGLRLMVYDKDPGTGFAQKFLALSWRVGGWLFKLRGAIDIAYAAESWDDAFRWLATVEPGKTISEVQYWGHGGPGRVILGGDAFGSSRLQAAMLTNPNLRTFRERLRSGSVIWFRCCNTFQGALGYKFSAIFADYFNCTIAGFTRVIGPVQGGLHTRQPFTPAHWSEFEGNTPHPILPQVLQWSSNSVTCLASKIPKGW